ncbi:MAG: hypothetical protein Q7U20_09920 [Caulobacter sp.]|nr:hypothetical protein [Caulobacter sp.]
MLKSIVAAGALALAISAPGASFAQSSLLTDWGVADMKAALVAAGATVTKDGVLDDDVPYVAATTANGLKFVVYGTVCTGAPTRCKGANMTTSFTLGSDAEVDAREKEIDRSAVGVRNAGDKSLEVSRYLIFDEGLTRGNLKTNIMVFMDVAEEIWNGGGK